MSTEKLWQDKPSARDWRFMLCCMPMKMYDILKKVGSVDQKNNNHLTNLLDWLIDLLVVNAGSAVFQPFNEC